MELLQPNQAHQVFAATPDLTVCESFIHFKEHAMLGRATLAASGRCLVSAFEVVPGDSLAAALSSLYCSTASLLRPKTHAIRENSCPNHRQSLRIGNHTKNRSRRDRGNLASMRG